MCPLEGEMGSVESAQVAAPLEPTVLPHYVHFYWGNAPDSDACPPLSASRNLGKWSTALNESEFLPILWCNNATYQAILKKNGSGIIPKLNIRERLKSNWKKAFDQFTEKTPELADYFFWLFENHQQLSQKKPNDPNATMHTTKFYRKVLVCNIEAFLKVQIHRYYPTYKKTASQFAVMLECIQILNELELYAYAKNSLVPLLVGYFGGFYFDIDITPLRPFYRSIEDPVLRDFLSSVSELELNKPTIFTYLKIFNLNRDKKYAEQDIGFFFNPVPLVFVESPGADQKNCLYCVKPEYLEHILQNNLPLNADMPSRIIFDSIAQSNPALKFVGWLRKEMDSFNSEGEKKRSFKERKELLDFFLREAPCFDCTMLFYLRRGEKLRNVTPRTMCNDKFIEMLKLAFFREKEKKACFNKPLLENLNRYALFKMSYMDLDDALKNKQVELMREFNKSVLDYCCSHQLRSYPFVFEEVVVEIDKYGISPMGGLIMIFVQ